MNQTVCGLSLSRSQLMCFAHVTWTDTFPESGVRPTGCGGCARAAPPWPDGVAATPARAGIA